MHAGAGAAAGEEDVPASMHPYAQAYTSLRGRDVDERDELAAQMRGLGVGPSTSNTPMGYGHGHGHGHGPGHIRAPSQPAPDYDTHSFVNMPPPMPALPPLPIPQGSGGMRSPPGGSGRRVLTVVNGDANSMPAEDPGLVLHAERERRIRQQQQQQQQQQQRMSYADSVYEMPPPAYDAIDFSVPPVPPLPQGMQRIAALPQQPQMAPLPPTPLPAPPVEAGGEGQRGP